MTDSAFINQHPTSGRIPLCIGGDVSIVVVVVGRKD